MTSDPRWSRGLPALLASALVLTLAACTSSPRESTPVREVSIGLLAPLSGPGRTAQGQDAGRGAELAALVVNEAGAVPVPLGNGAGLPGLGGARLRIITVDSRGNAAVDTQRNLDQAASQATRLATVQHVTGLISAEAAAATAVASERTERTGVPFLGAAASADYLTERGLDWFFRVTPTDRMLAEACVALLVQRGGNATRRLGLVHANEPTSNDATTAVQRLAREAGDSVADPAAFAPGSNARPAVDRVRGANPDAVVAVAAQPADATALLTAGALSGGQRPLSLGMGAGFTPSTIRKATQATGTDVLHSTIWSQDFAERNLAGNAVADLYQQRFHAPMTEAAAETFTATITLAQAINAAGSLDPQRVRTALLSLNVPGRDTIMPWGGIRFDQTGQNVQAAGLVERVTRDDARVVFPPELSADA